MATSSGMPSDLDQLASDLRAAASRLDSFATTLQPKVAQLKWEGPAADTFRAGVRSHQGLLVQAIRLLGQLSSRLEGLVEDAQALHGRVEVEQTAVVGRATQEVKDLQALAKADHKPADQVSPQTDALLQQQGKKYEALAATLKSLGATAHG